MSLADLVGSDESAKAELAEMQKATERVSYLEGELDKAIKSRDTAKSAGRMSADEHRELTELRTKAADAEEERMRKDGEFETLKTKLAGEKADAEAKATAAEQRFADKVIETAFYGATELFGPTGLTTLTPEFAQPAFQRHVQYVPGENGSKGSLAVTGLDGEPITNEKGDPRPFAEAMGVLIDQWPSKDAILRGGGKTGSGAGPSPESFNVTTATRAETVAAAQAGDQSAIAHLKATRPGGQVSGQHWEDKAAAQRAAG